MNIGTIRVSGISGIGCGLSGNVIVVPSVWAIIVPEAIVV